MSGGAAGRCARRARLGAALPVGLALLGLWGCGAPDPALPAPDARRAMSEVEALVALGPRDAGTEGAARAAAHILARLREAGIEAEIDEFTDDTPRGPLPFRNVIGRLPGRGGGLIVLGSHFDTMSGIGEGFQGANDSGSSTGLLIELARTLAAGPTLGPGILFAFFDGEECQVAYRSNDGLHGSRRLARRLADDGRAPGVLAVIVLDMIGDRDLRVQLPRNTTPALAARTLEAARAEGVRPFFTLYPGAILDDHVPFLKRGMPAVLMIDFEYGSAPGLNDYWHTLEDSLDKLSVESLDIVGRVALRLVRDLAADPPRGRRARGP